MNTFPEAAAIDVAYREIPDFPGYRVGDDGSVWGRRKSGRGYGTFREWARLKPTTTDRGRLVVHLRRDRKKFPKQVHAMVMLAFVGPYPEGKMICHFDGNHLNNRLENLRYDTRQGNEVDTIRHGRRVRGDRHPVAKLNAESVGAVKRLLAEGHSLTPLARRFGVSKKTILNVKHGRVWKWVVAACPEAS